MNLIFNFQNFPNSENFSFLDSTSSVTRSFTIASYSWLSFPVSFLMSNFAFVLVFLGCIECKVNFALKIQLINQSILFFFYFCRTTEVDVQKNPEQISSDLDIINTDQRSFSFESPLYITWKSVNNFDSVLISTENQFFESSKLRARQCCFNSTLNFSDTELFFFGFRITIFNSFYMFLQSFQNISFLRHRILDCEKKWTIWISSSISFSRIITKAHI